MSTTSLPTGKYYIFSKATDFIVGRNIIMSPIFPPRPQPILTLDPEVPQYAGPNRVWEIKAIGGGKYTMACGPKDSPVGVQDGGVVAFLTKEDQAHANEWRIEHVPQQGKDTYLIVRDDYEIGWIAEHKDADLKQIKAGLLIVFPTYPPKYPTTELFVIKPAKEDE